MSGERGSACRTLEASLHHIRPQLQAGVGRISLGHSVTALIEGLFGRLEAVHGATLCRTVFGLLCAAREGLSSADLLHLLSSDDDVLIDVFQFHKPPARRMPGLVLKRLLSDVQAWGGLVERGQSGELGFYHRQVISQSGEERVGGGRGHSEQGGGEERPQRAHGHALYRGQVGG